MRLEGVAKNKYPQQTEGQSPPHCAQTSRQIESAPPAGKERSWRGWKIRLVHVFLLLLLITTFAALFTLGSYNWKDSLRGSASQTLRIGRLSKFESSFYGYSRTTNRASCCGAMLLR